MPQLLSAPGPFTLQSMDQGSSASGRSSGSLLPMYKQVRGNQIFSTGRNKWPIQALQFGGKTLKFEVVRDWSVSMVPKTKFQVTGHSLELPPQKRNAMPLVNRAFQFKTEAVSLITTEHYTPARAWSQDARDSEKDSGNEVARDEEIPPAIGYDEQVIFNHYLSRLHQLYHHARKASSNTQGKAFIKAFCDILLTPPHQVLMSTNPNGRHQPGSMSVEWIIGEDWRGESARHVQRQRRALGEEERVADVIIWDGSVVTVVFEIKSDTASGGIQQNKEQMAGLLQKGQKGS